MKVNETLTPQALMPSLKRAFELAAQKTAALEKRWNVADGAPVFTAAGRYPARRWTQWTPGFHYGHALL